MPPLPKSGPQGLNAIYLYQNAMQSAVTARFSDMYGNWNGLRVAQVFGEEISIGYVDGWLSASTRPALWHWRISSCRICWPG